MLSPSGARKLPQKKKIVSERFTCEAYSDVAVRKLPGKSAKLLAEALGGAAQAVTVQGIDDVTPCRLRKNGRRDTCLVQPLPHK